MTALPTQPPEFREWSSGLRNPLAQAGTVWKRVQPADLEATRRALQLRRVDPGGLLAMSGQVLGPVTEWAALGNNVIGAWNWRGVDLADQYRAVMSAAGAFIASAMCYLKVSGPDAGRVLDALSPRSVSDIPVNAAKFVLFTTPAGTVDEEAVVVRTGPEEFLLSCGGGKPPSWLNLMAEGFAVCVEPSSVFSFNIKGPQRLAAVQSLVDSQSDDAVAALEPFQSRLVGTQVGGLARVLRSVIGYEVWAEQDVLAAVWRQLLEDRPAITPCGWELLTVYRLECQEILFGLFPVDLHAGTTLFEVGAGWMVRSDRHAQRNFVGREALTTASGAKRFRLTGLRAVDDNAIQPVLGQEVLTAARHFAGYVTSAAWSPREGRFLAFAHLLPESVNGSEVHVAGARWEVRSVPFGVGS
ncbi:aminomethyl transferase family protein [Amycolatopsis sp. NPDC051071]|uniref:aminomethyl transferase family protein n=1 Tax=Amycolatopsis sp. NPDC051071 TaxID=3154637 RepID=UPI0034402515